MKDIAESDFGTDVLDNPRLTLVDFWAEWCGPCKALAPVFDEVAARLGERMDFVKFNVDSDPSLPSRYGVRGIPALLLFKNGVPVDRRTGLQTASQLTGFLAAHLDPAQAAAPAPARPLAAFGGDERLKRESLARLDACMAAKTVSAGGHTFWDGESGSPLGCASRQPDQAGAASCLGLPPELVEVVDLIENFSGEAAVPGSFSASWLNAIQPGTDTGTWPAALLPRILRGETVTGLAGGDPGLAALRDRIAELANTRFDDAEARRLACSAISEACTGHPAYTPLRRGGSLASFFNQLAWEISDGQHGPGSAVSGLAAVLFDSTRQRAGWNEDDQAAFDALGKKVFERAQAEGATARVPDLMREENAELTDRYAAMIEAYGKAARGLGDEVRRLLLLQAGQG